MLTSSRFPGVIGPTQNRRSFSVVPVLLRNNFRKKKEAQLYPQHTITKVMDGLYPSLPIQKYFRSTDYKKERSQMTRAHVNYSSPAQPTAHYSITAFRFPRCTPRIALCLRGNDLAPFKKESTGPYWFYKDQHGVTSDDFDFF